MNLLSEVLSCAKKVELDEINTKVPELQLMVANMKGEIIQYTENIYVKYSGRPKQNRLLYTRAQDVAEEIKTLKKNAEEATLVGLEQCDKDLENRISTLSTLDITLNIVSRFCEINQQLITFTNLQTSKDYLPCIKLLAEIDSLINEIPDDEYVDIIDKLKDDLVSKRVSLETELMNVFNKNVVIELIEGNGAKVKVCKSLTELERALLAIYHGASVIYPLDSFARSLLDNILVPIVNNTAIVNISEDDIFHIMEINIDLGTKPPCLDLFHNLETIIRFLKTNFDLILEEKLTTLKYIGIDIKDSLSELLIKRCLHDTIPSTSEGLQKYNVVIDATEILEKALIECSIFDESTESLVKYTKNIDVLYITKKCDEYFNNTYQLMKKDLQDMVEVGEPYNPENPFRPTVNEFQHCYVSKSVLEMLGFLEKVIQQAVTASDNCACHLIRTVKNIIITYGQFVPEYHSKLLQTIPQQVALFHNNCLYIGYQMTKWNQMYSQKLASKIVDECLFIDEVHHLEVIGSTLLASFVESQLKQIDEIMAGSGLAGPTLDNLQPTVEKCLRQCLRQQELLKTVWHKVLSYRVYNKNMGILLDSMCSCIITSLTKLEDIPSNVAEQLIEILKLVLTRGPKLFTDPKEVSLYVKSWFKFNEINFILGANLLSINDRWADGKGPLALQFKPSELKSLIRALFQNTDRRSAVLAKIQE